MRITRVHIENYRSIRALDFYPDDYSVLIGDNNAGKSNILRAINLVLGETWPTDRTFTREDFHGHNSEQDIVIQVYFDTVLEKWKNMSLKVYGFELRGRAYKRAHRGMPRGTITVDYTCINEKGETVRYPAEPLQAGKAAKIWYDLKVSREFRDSLPLIYIDRLRDYHHQDPSYRWSALRKIINDVSTGINNDRTMVKVLTGEGEVKMTRQQAFEYKMSEAYAYLRNPDLLSIEENIGFSLEQLGFGPRSSDITVKMTLTDPVDTCRDLHLLVDQMGSSTAAEFAGAGMQSALVIAVLRAYAEIKREGAVIAIETPEIFLHPRKVGQFRDALRDLSIAHQVLIVTHSPEFVDISRPGEIHLVRRSAQEGTWLINCGPDQFGIEERQEMARLNFEDSGRHQMFFAAGVVLVADAVHRLAVSLTARSMTRGLSRAGISVIACGGKSNLLRYAKIADACGIPYVVVADSGFSQEEEAWGPDYGAAVQPVDQHHRPVNEALRAGIKGEDLFWLYPDLAAAVGLRAESPDIQSEIAGYFSSHRAEDLPPALVQALRQIYSLTEG
ncbi:MAG: AAA family ATPase [Syntrophomonadaceae bacterium]